MAEAMMGEERTRTVQKADSKPVVGPIGASAIRPLLAVSLIVLGALLWGAQRPDSASAASQIYSFQALPSTTEAGGHPNVFTSVRVGNRLTEEPIPCDCNDPRDITIETPPGVIANTHALPACSAAEMVILACPPDTQVGVVTLVTGVFPPLLLPLHRTVEQGDSAGLYAFVLPLGVRIIDYLSINARTGSDYGLNFKSQGITHFLPVQGFDTIFWGVPAAHIHDKLRFPQYGAYIPCFGESEPDLIDDTLGQACNDVLVIEKEGEGEFEAPKSPVGVSVPVRPFTQNPTTCSGPLEAHIHDLAYDGEETHSLTEWPETTGCDQLSFFPSLAANPTTTQTDTASGLEIDLKVPQTSSPGTPSPSEIRANTITMPEGFSLNSNGSDGKVACTDAEARFGTVEAAQCPEFSKIGTVEMDSTALPAPIDGYAYLGEPKPNDRYRVILTANGFGTHVKLAGSTQADPSTGRLTLSLQDLPQTPFQEFRLHLFGSERGIFATPTKCQGYEVNSRFTPWASELSDQTSTQFFTLDSGPNGEQCPAGTRPFAPALAAGSADNTAGRHSSYGLKITRQDGEQNLAGLEASQPPGLAATLKGVPYCPEAAISTLLSAGYLGSTELSTPACPTASQVGSVATASGAGTKPLNLAGKVYLAGPYKGAPLSLVSVVPAVTGPYDLGNVVVRAALDVDPATAQVSVRSDPLPQIIGGIPLRTRSLQVVLDRPDFALNPTNCTRSQVVATVSGNEGGQKSPATGYQVANCSDLKFGPKLKLSLRGSTKRRGHPALRAVLNANAGEANIKRTVVALPKNLILDNSRIGTVCTRAQFAAESCPSGSAVGRATVSTPLLDAPLSGLVYLRSSSHRLPDLVVDLQGQFEIELVGRIGSTKAGGLRTVFEAVPDAPVSRFELNLDGKRRGLLQSTVSLCKGGRRAAVKMVGQNGRRLSRNTKLQSKCGSAKRKRRRAARHSRRNR